MTTIQATFTSIFGQLWILPQSASGCWSEPIIDRLYQIQDRGLGMLWPIEAVRAEHVNNEGSEVPVKWIMNFPRLDEMITLNVISMIVAIDWEHNTSR